MTTATIGVLHPGSMGAALARSMVRAGQSVYYASEGRSEETRRRAEDAGVIDTRTLSALTARCTKVVSICPPGAATDVAALVADTGFAGTYVDANAIASETATEIAGIVGASGARFVDAAVVGPAAFERRRTHLVLSGEGARDVAALFEPGEPETLVLDAPIGTASAIKVCYAAWTKGTSALLIAIRALAVHEGVEDELRALWSTRDEDLERRSDQAVAKARTHGWRWEGEVEQIAKAFAAAGLPDGFHLAATDLFARFPREETEATISGAELLARLVDVRPVPTQRRNST